MSEVSVSRRRRSPSARSALAAYVYSVVSRIRSQLMLAFDLQLGCIVLPKSDNVAEMKENLNINFQISDEDMKKLVKLKENDQNVAV